MAALMLHHLLSRGQYGSNVCLVGAGLSVTDGYLKYLSVLNTISCAGILTSSHGDKINTRFWILSDVIVIWGGIAQWLGRRTRDRKVAGSNPCWSGGRIFFSRVSFLCWLLFRYPFHACITGVARKRPRSFCQKCRWQVTAKHAYTLRMWLCMKWHGAWLYGVHRTSRDGSSFMWHQPCQRCKYTPSVDIQKTRCKKLFTHVESHASAVSLLESGE